MAAEKSIGMALLKDIQCRSAQVEAGKSESNFRDGGGLWLVVSVDRKRWMEACQQSVWEKDQSLAWG